MRRGPLAMGALPADVDLGTLIRVTPIVAVPLDSSTPEPVAARCLPGRDARSGARWLGDRVPVNEPLPPPSAGGGRHGFDDEAYLNDTVPAPSRYHRFWARAAVAMATAVFGVLVS